MYCSPHPEEPRPLARRLEGWQQAPEFAAILRDAREERAPQDEVRDCFTGSQDEVGDCFSRSEPQDEVGNRLASFTVFRGTAKYFARSSRAIEV